MSTIHYVIVEHDGGWAYRLGDVVSETFPSHDAALAAARDVAARQRIPGETTTLTYQTPDGRWHEESSTGSDRPDADVIDPPH